MVSPDRYGKNRREESMISINATLILTVLNFILLIVVLRAILIKPMMKFLDERAKKIDESLRQADENAKRAEEMVAEHDQIVAEARSKSSEIVETAMSQASSESRAIVADAREKAQATIDTAREEIMMEAERIKQDLRKEVASMTVKLAGKVLEREISEKDHRELINKSLDIMGS